MAATVRTRLGTAYFVVDCLGGQEHRFTMTLDGQVSNAHHDTEQDAVLLALGGAPHPCNLAQRAHTAAREIFEGLAGEHDLPSLTRTRGGWRDGHQCRDCSRSLEHLHTTKHRASLHGTHERLVRTLLAWMKRNSDKHCFSAADATRPTTEFLAAARAVSPDFSPARFRFAVRGSIITAPFVREAAPFSSGKFENVALARGEGVRVEWLRELGAQVRPDALAHALRGDGTLLKTLARSRNVPARAVASYLNAGVTAHFYTYHRAHARPDQVLAVYRATGGRTTLADLLSRGMSVREAMVSVGAG